MQERNISFKKTRVVPYKCDLHFILPIPYFFCGGFMQSRMRGGSGFVGTEAYTILGAIFKKKNTKLGMKSDYLFWVLPVLGRGPCK
jgi:hypothetical protein